MEITRHGITIIAVAAEIGPSKMPIRKVPVRIIISLIRVAPVIRSLMPGVVLRIRVSGPVISPVSAMSAVVSGIIAVVALMTVPPSGCGC